MYLIPLFFGRLLRKMASPSRDREDTGRLLTLKKGMQCAQVYFQKNVLGSQISVSYDAAADCVSVHGCRCCTSTIPTSFEDSSKRSSIEIEHFSFTIWVYIICGEPTLEGVGFYDLLRSLPTLTILCDSILTYCFQKCSYSCSNNL